MVSLLIPSEVEALRKTLSESVGADFEAKEADAGIEFPPPEHKASWYVSASSPFNAGFACVAWRAKDGEIWIESISLGLTTRWVYDEYGREEAVDSLYLDYSDLSVVRSVFALLFPKVDERLKTCESILSDASSKDNVNLKLHCLGEHGFAGFYMIARVDTKKLDLEQQMERVKVAVEALERAWRQIHKHPVMKVKKRPGYSFEDIFRSYRIRKSVKFPFNVQGQRDRN